MTKEQEIFTEALEITTSQARLEYLQRACGQDPALRQNVEELLAEHFSDDKLLGETAFEREDPESITFHVAETPAPKIDGYRLLEKIGEGGMGEVWLSEPEKLIGGRVALKLIKMGMDTRAVIARFKAEGRALSLMDHPNIARVFDAGATDKGRPYLVMELVRGLKLTDYCDEHGLDIEKRLRLYIKICQAIQHAHQKGIIHRDLKPSNVLVTVEDGQAVPKLIDFGVAKAIEQKLTDKTVYTEFQALVGTPAYMSPEQASLRNMDIDTRSDIYGLGALLYELLVGRPPFEASELMSQGLDSLRRVIGQRDPLKPSVRLKTLCRAEQGFTAQVRDVDAPKLHHLLRGDLDRIVMRCLEKDRARRYQTADGLAIDLQHYLASEPVLAGPPGMAYRAGKLIRRHKLAFTTAVLVFLAAILGASAALSWQHGANHGYLAISPNGHLLVSRRGDKLSVWRADGPQQIWYTTGVPGHGVAFSPDSKWIAAGDQDGGVSLWEVASAGRTHRTLRGHAAPVLEVSFHPDGIRLASSSHDGVIKVWDWRAGIELMTFSGDRSLSHPLFSADGNKLAVIGGDGMVKLWNTQYPTAAEDDSARMDTDEH